MLKVGGIQVGLAPAKKTKSLLSPQVVEGSIYGDSIDPRTHFGLSFKFCRASKHISKDILGNFFGIGYVLGVTQGGVVHSIAKQSIQFPKRGLISAGDGL